LSLLSFARFSCRAIVIYIDQDFTRIWHGSVVASVGGHMVDRVNYGNAYGEGRKKPGRSERDIAGQIKMVAGARAVNESAHNPCRLG